MIAINEWPIGGIQHPHLDTYSNQEINHDTSPDKPSREWTCILYLNNNYHGGRTYIPDGEVFEPMKQVQVYYFKVSTFHMVFRKFEDTQDIQYHFGSLLMMIDVCQSIL